MVWLHQMLLRFRPYFILVERTKIIILPGFSPLPLYTVASFFFQEIVKDELTNKASSLAYSFMLAIFPAIIFLFTLIPYVPIDNFQEQLMSLIALILPAEAYAAVKVTLLDIVKNQNSRLLSFGFVFAIIFSTNGVHNLMEAFNKSSLIIETRSWFRQRMVALYLTLMVLFALIFALIVMTISEYILNILKSELRFKETFGFICLIWRDGQLSLFYISLLLHFYFVTDQHIQKNGNFLVPVHGCLPYWRYLLFGVFHFI